MLVLTTSQNGIYKKPQVSSVSSAWFKPFMFHKSSWFLESVPKQCQMCGSVWGPTDREQIEQSRRAVKKVSRWWTCHNGWGRASWLSTGFWLLSCGMPAGWLELVASDGCFAKHPKDKKLFKGIENERLDDPFYSKDTIIWSPCDNVCRGCREAVVCFCRRGT